MASINYAAREISVKIVYYGPGLSGKTTNLQVIHRKIPTENRSDMVSLATETDRTLFFDFLPIDLGKIKGFSTKFQLYTVPGQVYYNATRKLVLRGVDGVVFVADSAADKVDENLESFQNLEENLAEYGYKRENIPIVLQYNKRDLPNALPIPELDAQINKYGLPYGEAVAAKGKGVFESLKQIGKYVLDFLNKKYDRQSGGGAKRPQAQQVAPRPATPDAPADMPATPSFSSESTSPARQEWTPSAPATSQFSSFESQATPGPGHKQQSPFVSDPFDSDSSVPPPQNVQPVQPPSYSPDINKPEDDYSQYGSIPLEPSYHEQTTRPPVNSGGFDAEIEHYKSEIDNASPLPGAGLEQKDHLEPASPPQFQPAAQPLPEIAPEIPQPDFFQAPQQPQQPQQYQQQPQQYQQQPQQYQQQPQQYQQQPQQYQQQPQQYQQQPQQYQQQPQQYQQQPQQYQQQPQQQPQQYQQPGQQQRPGVNQNDYNVYNVEPPTFQVNSQQAPQQAQQQPDGNLDDTMYFTSVNTDSRKKPKKPVNPKINQKRGLFSRLFNRNQSE